MEVEGGEGKILVLKKVRKFPKKFPEVSAEVTSDFQNEETFYHYAAGGGAASWDEANAATVAPLHGRHQHGTVLPVDSTIEMAGLLR